MQDLSTEPKCRLALLALPGRRFYMTCCCLAVCASSKDLQVSCVHAMDKLQKLLFAARAVSQVCIILCDSSQLQRSGGAVRCGAACLVCCSAAGLFKVWVCVCVTRQPKCYLFFFLGHRTFAAVAPLSRWPACLPVPVRNSRTLSLSVCGGC